MKDLYNHSLLEHNTFGIEASCCRFLEYSSQDEASLVADMLRESSSHYIIIGGGSNLLLTRDYPGTVVHSAIKGIEQLPDYRLRCGSGVVWDDVVEYAVSHQLYGAENLSLIPGEVGASAVQNIGAYGAEVQELIESIEAVEIATGKPVVISHDECRYAYRFSRFKAEWRNRYLITSVTYRLSAEFSPRLDYGNIRSELERRGISQPSAAQLRQCIIDIRNEKLPDTQVEGNAGSFFMNPVVSREKYESLAAVYPSMPHYVVDDDHIKIPAGWMIDQCGWKGKTVGRAGVHAKQALVLVNRGGATGDEIVHLMQLIQHDVAEKFGIDINPEVNVI